MVLVRHTVALTVATHVFNLCTNCAARMLLPGVRHCGPYCFWPLLSRMGGCLSLSPVFLRRPIVWWLLPREAGASGSNSCAPVVVIR
jgi:hypothetical protein